MTSPSYSYISKTLLGLLLVGLLLSPVLIGAQEQDYTDEEYKVYQSIQAETDPVKKTDMVISFLKQTKSSLRKYASSEFHQVIVKLQGEKNWNQIISLCDKYLDVAQNDQIAINAMTAAYSATNNVKGFVAFGEKAYAAKPSPELAYALAKSYLSLNNEAKFLQWGERTLTGNPGNVEILFEMIRRSMVNQNMPQAVKYARMAIKALPKAEKPEDATADSWKNLVNNTYATAYAVIGSNAYQNRNYPEAITNLNNSVKYFKRNDNAYYHLGLCYWQQNKLEPAMLNFAKAYILKGPTSGSAKKYLDQLWSSSHRGSLAGMERLLARAEQDFK